MGHLGFDSRDLVPCSGVLIRVSFYLLQVSQLLKQRLAALTLFFEWRVMRAWVPQVKHALMDLALMSVRQIVRLLFSTRLLNLVAGGGRVWSHFLHTFSRLVILMVDSFEHQSGCAARLSSSPDR